MNELPSAEFRKRYAKLAEPTIVTVNGHVIGRWIPTGRVDVSSVERLFGLPPGSAGVTGGEANAEDTSAARREDMAPLIGWAAQKARDDLLNKINRRSE